MGPVSDRRLTAVRRGSLTTDAAVPPILAAAAIPFTGSLRSAGLPVSRRLLHLGSPANGLLRLTKAVDEATVLGNGSFSLGPVGGSQTATAPIGLLRTLVHMQGW